MSKFTVDQIAKMNLTWSAKFVLCWLQEHSSESFSQAKIIRELKINKKTLKAALEALNGLKINGVVFTPHDDFNNNNLNNNHDHGAKIYPLEVIQQLKSWHVFNPCSLIDEHGIDKIKAAIKLTIKYNARVPGAYFRTLLKNDLPIESQVEIRQKKEPYKLDTSMDGSPLDYDLNQAINYLNTIPGFLKNSFFARELRRKWDLKPA